MRSELQAATNALALVAEAAEAGGVAVGHLLPPPPTSLAGRRSPRSPKSKAKQDEEDEEELFVPEKRPLTKKQLRRQKARQRGQADAAAAKAKMDAAKSMLDAGSDGEDEDGEEDAAEAAAVAPPQPPKKKLTKTRQLSTHPLLKDSRPLGRITARSS